MALRRCWCVHTLFNIGRIVYVPLGLATGPGHLVSPPDIIAVGVQEMVKMRTDSVVMATASQMGKSISIIAPTSLITLPFSGPHIADAGLHLPWQQDIDRVLIPKGYERIGSKIMVGVYLAVYMKEDLVQYASNLQATVAPCGTLLHFSPHLSLPSHSFSI